MEQGVLKGVEMSLERTRSSRTAIDSKQGKTIPAKKTSGKKAITEELLKDRKVQKEYEKLKPKYEKITATIVLDWILKEIQIPIFSSNGVNQIRKIENKRKEWKV